MTDYHVRPVNGDDSNGGTGPDNAWKTFFSAASGGQGGTFNCAQVTDGDRVFLWAEGVTGGEIHYNYAFNWYWPLKNGNVSLIGVNENGVEDGTRYVIYLNQSWSSGFSINGQGGSYFSAYYPELTQIYEGNPNYVCILKNIRWTESKTIDSTQTSANGNITIGNYMANSRPILVNCECGPFTTTAGGRGLPTHSRYSGDSLWLGCYFHDIASVGDNEMADVQIVGCVFNNINSTIDVGMYGSGTAIINNVFANFGGNGVINLDEAANGEYAFGLIANNVFYNNDGYCIRTEDDQSISKILIHNNIFDSNGSVIDLNSITHTYASAGGSKNILLNNTNTIINSGSSTIEDFFTVGFGAGGSGGVGTSAGMENYYSGTIDYLSTTGTGDFRVKTSSSLDQLGLLNTTAGLGLAPFTTTDTGSFALGTGGVGDTVIVSGRSFQKVDDDPIVWRRV